MILKDLSDFPELNVEEIKETYRETIQETNSAIYSHVWDDSSNKSHAIHKWVVKVIDTSYNFQTEDGLKYQYATPLKKQDKPNFFQKLIKDLQEMFDVEHNKANVFIIAGVISSFISLGFFVFIVGTNNPLTGVIFVLMAIKAAISVLRYVLCTNVAEDM